MKYALAVLGGGFAGLMAGVLTAYYLILRPAQRRRAALKRRAGSS